MGFPEEYQLRSPAPGCLDMPDELTAHCVMRPRAILAVKVLASAAFASLSAFPTTAQATYSIVAVDTRTGAVGGAVASCVPLATLSRVYGASPGRGALMTQSYLKDEAHPDGLALLSLGQAPAGIVSALTDPAYDANFELRQYAVLDVTGRVAGFTGPKAIAHAEHATFSHQHFAFSVQGNVLTGPIVLEQAQTGFVSREACDLPARLMLALAAVGAEGAGDSRCVDSGFPAQSATLQVDPAHTAVGSYLRLAAESIGSPPSADPVLELRAQFDAWRIENPCPPDNTPPTTRDTTPESGACALASGKSTPAGGLLLVFVGCIAAWRLRQSLKEGDAAAGDHDATS